MIDYGKPDEDPVVEEVRRARESFAAEFDFDLDKIFDELERRQKASPEKYVSRQPVKIQPAKKVG